MTVALPPLLSRILRAYHLGLNHPIKIRLWTLLRRTTGYARLTLPYGNGGWITLDERDYLQTIIYTTGSYEPEIWEYLSPLLTADEVVWDIGAHIGCFTILAMQDQRVETVHSFEPDPLSYAILKKNLALNRGNAHAYPFALSNHQGHNKLYQGSLPNTGLSSLDSSSIVVHLSKHVVDVDCRTIDDLVFTEGFQPPTIIKLDVEGWELFVLQGAHRLLSEKQPRAIVFEADCDSSGSIKDVHIVDYLVRNKYVIQWIKRKSGDVEMRENFMAVKI